MHVIFECMNSLVVTRIMGIFADTVVPVVFYCASRRRVGVHQEKSGMHFSLLIAF